MNNNDIILKKWVTDRWAELILNLDGTTTKFLNQNGAFSTPPAPPDTSVVITLAEAWFGTKSSSSYTPIVTLPNSGVEAISCSILVPAGFTSISSVKIIYEANTTGDVMLLTKVNKRRIGSNSQDFDGIYRAYNSANGDATLREFTMNSDGWNSIGSLEAGDILGFQLQRDAGDVLDTFETTFPVVAVKVTFA